MRGRPSCTHIRPFVSGPLGKMNEGRGQAPAAWGTSGQGQTWAGCQLETGQNQIKQAYPERAQGSCDREAVRVRRGLCWPRGQCCPHEGWRLLLWSWGSTGIVLSPGKQSSEGHRGNRDLRKPGTCPRSVQESAAGSGQELM